MLFATTRNQNDVYTVYKAMHLDCAPDGGQFVPFRLPVWERKQLRQLAKNSFGQNVASVLNAYFSTELSGWDVEFAVGRSPVALTAVTSRLMVAECWHNVSWRFDHMVNTLADKLRKERMGETPNSWLQIAISVAVLFGIFGELLRNDERLLDNPVDIAVTTGDFAMPMAAWYGRKMGLPIGNIVCGCNTNGAAWNLIHHGQVSTADVSVKTTTPDADFVIPRNLERIISGTLGDKETRRFLQCCASGSAYALEQEELEKLREGLFAAVISDSRVESVIHSVYRTNQYVLSPYGALAYASLMDYRAKTRESRTAILITDRSPVCDCAFTAKCMDIPEAELHRILTRS